MPPETIAELRVKHLEMTQAVITRLAGSSAAIKNYCLTLCTAIAGISVTLQKPAVALLALVPIGVFAILDTQYLKNERRFRRHFDALRTEDWSTKPTFDMTPPDAEDFWSSFTSWSVVTFYGPLAAGVVAISIIIRCINGRFI